MGTVIAAVLRGRIGGGNASVLTAAAMLVANRHIAALAGKPAMA